MTVTLEHVERIEAAADAVWAFIRWDNLEAMAPGGFFAAVTYSERRPVAGATRAVTLGNGAVLVERLETEEAGTRTLRYRMLDTGGVPVADYRGEVVVSGCGAAACFVKFSSSCTPVGLSAADWRETWTGMQAANAAFIRGAVAKRP